MNAGIYFHYPFCLKKCNYCDFTSYEITKHKKDLIHSIQQEILERAKGKFSKFTYDTIYFGGGTPSLMDTEELNQVFYLLYEESSLTFSNHTEISMEANPETVTSDRVKQWILSGINRISMGAQSADDQVLVLSERIHQAEKIKEAFHILRDTGFQNINLDFILGLPGETDHTIKKNIDLITELNPEHLSIYFLTINENSKLFDQIKYGEIHLPLEEEVVSRWKVYTKEFAGMGYEHYEISNFCKPGKQCLHNLHYWHLDPYLGIGVSAVGFDGLVRYANPKSLKDYQNLDFSKLASKFKEKLTSAQLKREKIMLSFRLLLEGMEESLLQKNKKDTCKQWIQKGYLVEKEHRLYLTESGVIFSNQVISSLF